VKKLTNKIILLTGGNGLLGKALRENLLLQGATVINADIEAQDSTDFTSLNCDVTKEESIKRIVELILKHYGRIDGLINNAYPRTKDWGLKFEDIPFVSWQKNIDSQLNSCFLLSQAVLAGMKENKSGSIVNIGSVYGVVGPDFSIYEGTTMTMPAAYSAIKGGLINFTRYLASYYGPYQIRINCVSPGGVFDNQPEKFVQNYNRKVPMRRMANADDIAPAVSFLLSDDASYITGQNLIIDGGWTCI
jgi:NAD(P)-dependent dehydrogenase (short-subunit alcohol dehydrogenase family)